MEAMTYLGDAGRKAIIVSNRAAAFAFLTTCTTEAVDKIGHLQPRLGLQRTSLWGSSSSLSQTSSFLGRNQKQQPAGESAVTFDIAERRNLMLGKRRQSILENNTARKSLIYAGAPVCVSGPAAVAEAEADRGAGERRPREASLVGPAATSPAAAVSPGTNININMLQARGKFEKRVQLPPAPAPADTKQPAAKPISAPQLKFFQGRTTDPGYFPVSALESASILVAALQGRVRRAPSPVRLESEDEDEGSDEELVHLETGSFVVDYTVCDPTSFVGPVNSEVLSKIHKNMANHKQKKMFRKNTSLQEKHAVFDDMLNSQDQLANGSSLLASGSAIFGIAGGSNGGSPISVPHPLVRSPVPVSAPARSSSSSSSGLVSYQKTRHMTMTPSPSPSRVLIGSSPLDASHVQEKLLKSSHELLKNSLSQLYAIGYTTGDSSYRSYWVERLEEYSAVCRAEPKAAAKTVATLKNMTSGNIPLNSAEIFCALADSRGNVGEAVGRLCDPLGEYLSELRVICSVIKVDDYVTALSLNSHQSRNSLTAGSTMSPSSSAARLSPKSHEAGTGAIMAPDSSFIISRSKNEILTAVIPDPIELLRCRAGNDGVVGPSNPLPHFGMSQSSGFVRARGNKVKLGGSSSTATGSLLSSSLHFATSPVEISGLRKSLRDLATLPSECFQNSTRIDKNIEKQLDLFSRAGQETVVMSRRDALRAMQDEFLGKSPERTTLARCGGAKRMQRKQFEKRMTMMHEWYCFHFLYIFSLTDLTLSHNVFP